MLPSAGDYSALAKLPSYDQLAVWFSVFCVVQVMLKLPLRVLASRMSRTA